MNTNILERDASMKKTRVLVLSVMAVASVLTFSLAYTAVHADVLTSQMSVGSTGAVVSNLQSFLATSPRIYPEGLVTGYYGGLTKNAVTQFQAAYDIPQVGNVGPMTLARMNQVITSGLGIDITAPVIANTAVAVGNVSATVQWTTDTYATGQVYYDTQPIALTEALVSFSSPGISGSAVSNTAPNAVSQGITLQNLAPNTTYYYVVKATDASGNVSVSWPAVFHTNP